MSNKKKGIEFPNYLGKKGYEHAKAEKEKLDEIWDGETIDENKDSAFRSHEFN